jgi:uncharacterized protein
MASAPEARLAARENVRIPSGEEELAGWLYRPAAEAGASACVVLANGFGAEMRAGLAAYSERFAAAGYAALAFDYRHFGASGGEPRQLVSTRRQHQDWSAAIAHARALDGIDGGRVAAWGTSNSGGHVIHVAARDPGIAAAISQVPHTSGLATLRELEPRRMLHLTWLGLVDGARALAGRPPRYMPTVGPPGSVAAMTGDDAADGYAALYPEGYGWRNEVPARIMLTYALYSPGRDASRVGCPILFQVATEDHITPSAPALKAARDAPRGELITYPGGHFDIYRGEAFERAVADQLEFLGRHLPAT